MEPNPHFMEGFVQRFQQLEVHKDLSNSLIRDVLRYCDQLEQRNAELLHQQNDDKLELDDVRRSRRELQKELQSANQIIEQYNISYASITNRNPYVVVLIDGDGMIFHEDLIHKGIEGGKQAANAIRDTILQNCNELANEMEVMAKVCANVTGLAKAMQKDRSLENPADLRDFTLGFTQGKASFDFVDVGHGKERADSKIKECMRWHLRNHNCKQILLGISHDAGYAPFLDEVITTEDDRNRVTIVEGPPIVRELAATGLNVMNLKQIFRTEKLIDRTLTPPPDRVISPPVTNGATTWANAAKSGTPAPAATPILLKTPASTATVPKSAATVKVSAVRSSWTPGPLGLDPPLKVNASVLERVKRRTNSDKLCNNHYLRGPCAKGDECIFEHKHKCTEDELTAIAFLARLNPCVSGQDCDIEYCIYGHHCPSVNLDGKQPVCNAYSCKFQEEDHPPHTKIKHPKKTEDGYYKKWD